MNMIATFCISIALLLSCCTPGSAQEQRTRVSFRYDRMELAAAMDSLMRRYDVSVVYFDEQVRGISVRAVCASCTLDEALDQVLDGTGLTWIAMGRQIVLRPRAVQPARVASAVNGLISDSLTGTSLAGAVVALRDAAADSAGATRMVCPTNAFGFYSLRDIGPGSYTLSVRRVGYAPRQLHVVIVPGESPRLDIALQQEEIPMQEFTVEGHRTASTPAEGFVHGTYLRSIPSDQTQFLLDGARVFNPSHFGGTSETFPPELLNEVEPMVGGLPPYYGGRIGGLLDLSVRDGTGDRLKGIAGIGTLGAEVVFEGPVSPATSYVLSARRTYPYPALALLEPDASPNRAGSYEVDGKIQSRVSGSSRLYVNGLLSEDVYTNVAGATGGDLRNTFTWGNQMLNVRWLGISSPSLFLFGSLAYSRYDLNLAHNMASSVPAAGPSLNSDYRMEDLTLRFHAEHFYDREHTLRGGVEITEHGIGGSISAFSSNLLPLSIQGFSAWELSVYLQDQWRITPGLLAELGARATSFAGSGGSRSGIDPRFSLVGELGEASRLYASVTSINQFIHPYRSTGVFYYYPALMWYPSDDHVRPSTSMHFVAGMEDSWGNDAWTGNAECYYRITRDTHGFTVAAVSPAAQELTDAIIYGSERAYGLSVSLRKRYGAITGTVRYSLSWLWDAFPDVNNGVAFASPFDRRHEVELWTSYTPGNDWAFGVLCVIASTPQVPVPAPLAPAEPHAFGDVRAVTAAGPDIDANGARTPGFQRLEFSIMKRFAFWSVPCQVTLRMINAYGLLDPFEWQVSTGGAARPWTIVQRELHLFPLYPTLSLHVHF